MKYIIVIILVYSVLNIYVFFRGWQVLPHNIYFKIIYICLSVLLASSFFMAMLGRSSLPLPVMKALMLTGSTWMLAFLYLFIILIAIDLFRILNHFFHIFPSFIQENKILSGQFIFITIILGLITLFSIGYHKFSHPVIKKLEINVDKFANGRKSLHIVAVSDVHLGFTIDKERLKKYVKQINSLNPEIILIAGDLIDIHTRPLEEQKMYEELLQLKAPLGVYMVPGNHEYISGQKASDAFIAKTGIRELKNEFVSPDSTFILIGQDDFSSGKQEMLGEILKKIDHKNLPLLCMNHQPHDKNMDDAFNNHIDLYICGHTHLGQVWPMSEIVKKTYRIPYGYKTEGDTHFYVSSGLGLWGPPYRLGTQSEIIDIKLNFKQ